MIKSTTPLTALALLMAIGLQATPARAQLARTYVSVAGNDGSTCERPTPCRTFQGAHNKTADQGEITVLDPGGYGAVTITKSISIINDGVGDAGPLVSGGATGITIAAPPGSNVNLRGITVQGIGFGGGIGILFNSGGSLTIDHCVVRGLTGDGNTGRGIVFDSTVAGTPSVSVLNSLVADNAFYGIHVLPHASVNATLLVRGVEMIHNGAAGLFVNGVAAVGTINATMADSFSANNEEGVFVFSNSGGADTHLTVLRSALANNSNVGLAVTGGPNASLLLGQTGVSGNKVGAFNLADGAVLQSFGDNYFDFGNTAVRFAVIPRS